MKKTLSIIFSIIIAFSMVSFNGITSFAADSSGSCGEGVTWKYTESNKTLTISGDNIMDNYIKDGSSYNRPWESLTESIECVVIKNGVLSVGDYAFAGFENLKDVTISETVLVIGEGAFKSCTALRFVDLGKNVMAIGPSAFESCSMLSLIELSEETFYIGNDAFNNSPITHVVYTGLKEQLSLIYFEDESETFKNVKCCNTVYDFVVDVGDYDVFSVVSEEPFSLLIDDSCAKIITEEYEKVTEAGIDYYIGSVAICGVENGRCPIYAVDKDGVVIDAFACLSGCTSKHSYTDEGTGREPTCIDKGFYVLYCEYCGHAERSDYEYSQIHKIEKYETIKEATCEEKGVRKGQCELCKEWFEEPLNMLGHIWSEWTVTVEPTEEEKGQQERTCSRCNEKEIKEILSLSESIGDVNGDGKITAVDARMILQHVAGINKLDEHQLKLADVNSDNKISAVDARRILRIVAGITE